MNVILLGPPASGKGTQAQIIEQEFGIKHYSTGNLLRKETQKGTELGDQIKQIIGKGNLVPDQIIFKLIQEDLSHDVDNHLFDGFPRTLAQADWLTHLAEKIGMDIIVIFIDVSDKEVIHRIAGRRLDPKTQDTYHIEYNPPPPGVQVIQREDDTEEHIKNRLKVYHEQTAPLEQYYESHSKFYHLNGEQPIEEVAKKIAKILND